MIEVKVESMSCGGCAASVTKAIKQADPKATVEVDLVSKQVRIDTVEDRATIVQVLTKAGYPSA